MQNNNYIWQLHSNSIDDSGSDVDGADDDNRLSRQWQCKQHKWNWINNKHSHICGFDIDIDKEPGWNDVAADERLNERNRTNTDHHDIDETHYHYHYTEHC